MRKFLEAEPDEIPWLWFWRRQGSGPTGSSDCRALQRAVLNGEIKTLRGLLMPMALRSTIFEKGFKRESKVCIEAEVVRELTF